MIGSAAARGAHRSAARRPSLADASAVLVLVAVVLTAVLAPLAGLLSRTALSPRAAPRAGVDAIVVLGSTLEDGRVPALLASRLDRAAGLYRAEVAAGGAPRVVVTGGAPAGGPTEASAMADYLARAGVPSGRLLVEDRASTTRENLALTAPLLHQRGAAPRVVVVTSDFHAWRTGELARRSGFDVQVVGAPSPPGALPRALLREAALVLGLQGWTGALGWVGAAAAVRLAWRAGRGRPLGWTSAGRRPRVDAVTLAREVPAPG